MIKFAKKMFFLPLTLNWPKQSILIFPSVRDNNRYFNPIASMLFDVSTVIHKMFETNCSFHVKIAREGKS